MTVKIESSWKSALAGEFDKPYWRELTEFVRGEYLSGKQIYPAPANIFAAFDMCPINDVRVVIIGQDPYHEPGQAMGLCFSVPDGVRIPPSLQNIYKELENDLGTMDDGRWKNGNLTRWAKQGVLLLNSTLTVSAHLAASHAGKGWEHWTDAVIRALSQRTGIVYMLWGSYAQRKAEIINPSENLILKSVHPSPLSAHRGFFGNHHFSQANKYLTAQGKPAIEW
ncbi:MAG: uracil-DNA glycosylase [Rickettsiales bacterium]|jgi:uracil-DNA glycosylase|nr:uracil-DNA glycosylase [Rickettsiales bacterium]